MTPVEEQPFRAVENIQKKITLRDRICNIKEHITVEPVIACCLLPTNIVKMATQNLNLDKACRVNLNYGNTVCDALLARQGNAYQTEELAVQHLVASNESWNSIVRSALPCLLILFIAAWSDRTGKRKIFIFTPIIGDLFMCLSNVLSVYYFKEIPLQVTMFFEVFCPGIAGGFMTFRTAVYAYAIDISSAKSRTLKIATVNLFFRAAESIGTAVSGVLLKLIGYYGVFLLSSLMYIFGILYCFYFIQDPEKFETLENTEVTKNDSDQRCFFLKSFFDINNAKKTLLMAFKKGPYQRRTKMILILTSVFLIFGTASSSISSLLYLFTRYRLDWDAVKFSIFKTYVIGSHLFGTAILIGFLKPHFKWDDAVLGFLSICSNVLFLVISALSRSSRDMYIASTLGMFDAVGLIVLRSYASKSCSKNEIGKCMSVFNLTEEIALVIFVPIYSWIYLYTVEFDAGIFFYFSCVLLMPSLFIFRWFYKHHKTISNQKENEEKDDEREDIEVKDGSIEDISNKKTYTLVSTDDLGDVKTQ